VLTGARTTGGWKWTLMLGVAAQEVDDSTKDREHAASDARKRLNLRFICLSILVAVRGIDFGVRPWTGCRFVKEIATGA